MHAPIYALPIAHAHYSHILIYTHMLTAHTLFIAHYPYIVINPPVGQTPLMGHLPNWVGFVYSLTLAQIL